MKKIICLALALTVVLALVSCGACATCKDDDLDGKCDVCGGEVVHPQAEFFAMIENSAPNKIQTVVTHTRGDEEDAKKFTSEYVTFINENGYEFNYNIERAGNPLLDDTSVVNIAGAIVYADGVYYVNGEEQIGAPSIEYIDVKRELTVQNIRDYTMNRTGKVLTAVISPETAYTIFGVNVDADDITLEITVDGVRLSQVALSYTDSNGTSVYSLTSYEYVPAADAQ